MRDSAKSSSGLEQVVADSCIPWSEDEKDVQLNGRNQIDQHFFSGWGSIWKGVRDFDESLLIQRLNVSDIPSKYGDHFGWDQNNACLIKKDSKEPCTTLKEIWKRSSFTDVIIEEPLSLRVVEKKCVTSTASGYMMTKLVVSDNTGCCWFVMFNDTIVSAYDQLQVGSVFVATGLKFRKNDWKKDAFEEKLNLNRETIFGMELKINMFEYKRIFVIDIDLPLCSESLYPAKGVWLPVELLSAHDQRYFFPAGAATIAVTGVICYVSSILRSRKVDGKNVDLTNLDFHCYRWIQLIDRKTLKPLTIKLYLNNLSWDIQADIVPGSAVIFTNVTAYDYDSCLEFYLESTWYTKVYLNRKLAHVYLKNSPKVYRNTCKGVAAVQACQLILQNKKLTWSAGGFPHLKIVNSAVLGRMIRESNERNFNIVQLARREVLRLFVKGYIYRIQVVTCDNDNNVHYKLLWSDPYFPNMSYYGNECARSIDTFIADPAKYWFAYRKELPKPFQVEDLAEEIFLTYEKNQSRYKKMLSPLLMPSKTNLEAECQLRDLPVNPSRYFVLWVADPEKKILVSSMWTSRPFDEMESYLKENVMHSVKPAERMADASMKDREELRADSLFFFHVLQIESKGNEASENVQVDLMDMTYQSRHDVYDL